MPICSYALILLKDQWMIERLGAALIGNNISRTPSKISFYMRKKIRCHCRIFLQSIKTFLTLEVSIARVVALFPQGSRSRPAASASGCRRLGNAGALCLCSPVRARPPRAQLLNLQSRPSIISCNSLREWSSDCQMTRRSSNLDSNLDSAAWSTSCKGIICSEIPA